MLYFINVQLFNEYFYQQFYFINFVYQDHYLKPHTIFGAWFGINIVWL